MHVGKEQNHWVIQYLMFDFPNQEKKSICIFKKMLLQPAVFIKRLTIFIMLHMTSNLQVALKPSIPTHENQIVHHT
jgi:hypothetical protein